MRQECTSYRNLKFYTGDRIKTYTSNFPWKKCWLMTSIHYWRDPCAFYKQKTVLLKLAKIDVISQFILPIGLTGKSFKLISTLGSQDLAWSLFFPVNLGLWILNVLKMYNLWMFKDHVWGIFISIFLKITSFTRVKFH